MITAGVRSAPDATPRPRRRVTAWIVLLGISLVLAMLPRLLVVTPDPQEGLTLSTAMFAPDGGPALQVSLPHVWSPDRFAEQATARYQLTFTGADLPPGPLAIFIPMVRQNIEMWLNGTRIPPDSSNIWTSARSGHYVVGELPDALVQPGSNLLELRLSRADGWISAYVAQVHLLPQVTAQPYLRFQDIVVEQVWAISIALQFLLAGSVLMILMLRRHDPVYRWLSLMAMGSICVVVLQSSMLAGHGDLRPFSAALQAAVGVMSVTVARVVAGLPSPRMVQRVVAVGLVGLMLAACIGLVPVPLVVLVGALVTVTAFGLAALVLARHFARCHDWVAAILAIPFALASGIGLHDICLAFGLIDGPHMMAPYARMLFLLAIMVLLNGRLAQSLNRLDATHVTLQNRLADREAELNLLHQQERRRAALRVLSDERERLTHDLHDGLSGHLVSILAQSELREVDGPAIHQSAREALEDLRLVVLSLDLGEGEGELRLALAGLRERLEVQLRRQRVALDWSMEALPDVAGMTPGHGLTILRILQEAVTNALKHGPARQISIRGAADPSGGARITIQNDADPAAPPPLPGRGHGLANIRKRAASLGGTARLELLGSGACLTLRLPAVLGS